MVSDLTANLEWLRQPDGMEHPVDELMRIRNLFVSSQAFRVHGYIGHTSASRLVCKAGTSLLDIVCGVFVSAGYVARSYSIG